MVSEGLEEGIRAVETNEKHNSNYHFCNDLEFRSVNESDFAVMKSLHEEFFPVRYSDDFYKDMVKGIGICKGQLFSCIAVSKSTREVVGFVLAQMLPYPSRSEDRDLYSSESTHSLVCYILTLGIRENYRRLGLASYLIEVCKAYSRSSNDCGAVYLHVIHNNSAAIRFYQRNGFIRLRCLNEFYRIKGQHHDAHLYIFYVNGCSAPSLQTTSGAISAILAASFELVSSFLSLLSSLTSASSSRDSRSRISPTSSVDSANKYHNNEVYSNNVSNVSGTGSCEVGVNDGRLSIVSFIPLKFSEPQL